METKEFTMALAVGMNAAAHVALDAGHRDAAHVIRAYIRQWEGKMRTKSPRVMVASDIFPQNGAARYATADDLGITAWNTRTGDPA